MVEQKLRLLSGQRHAPHCCPQQPEELVPLDFADISMGQTRNYSFDAGKMVGLAVRGKLTCFSECCRDIKCGWDSYSCLSRVDHMVTLELQLKVGKILSVSLFIFGKARL